VAVVTNIDFEHMDHYGDMDALRNAFIDFINKIPFYGIAIICMDNEEIQGILPHLKKRYLTYGTSTQADLRAKDIELGTFEVNFEVVSQDRSLGQVVVGMPGQHNVLNALAAIAVGMELEMAFEDIKNGLINLGCLERRFQVKGDVGGIMVLDDYGHHPTEILLTLETARACWPERRLIVVFQPHRYSRTKLLYDRFMLSFNDADLLILAPLYPAGESPISGVNSDWLYRGIREHGHKDVYLAKNRDEIIFHLTEILRPGDVVMTLGAGDIYQVGNELFRRLKASIS
jgi:UDP-N-acetylmuramate--alanine ligase